MKDPVTSDLIGLLQIKKNLLSDMLRYTKKAAQLLAEDSFEGFDRELNNCENVMSMVDELGKTEKMLQSAAEGDADVRQLRNEIDCIINQIADANKECTAISKSKLNTFGSQIKALRQTRQGMDVYAGQASPDAVFVDAKK